jgi:hypothetical protein
LALFPATASIHRTGHLGLLTPPLLLTPPQELKQERVARADLQEQLWQLNRAAAAALVDAPAAVIPAAQQQLPVLAAEGAAQQHQPVFQHDSALQLRKLQLLCRTSVQQQEQEPQDGLGHQQPDQQQQQLCSTVQPGHSRPPKASHASSTLNCQPAARNQQKQLLSQELQQHLQLHIHTQQHEQQQQQQQPSPQSWHTFNLIPQPQSTAAAHSSICISPCVTTPSMLPAAPAVHTATPNTTPARSCASSPAATVSMQHNSGRSKQAPCMSSSVSSLHRPADEGLAAAITAPAAAEAAAVAAAAVLSGDAADMLWGAAAVRRSNDELLLAESVVSSSDSDSDKGTVAGYHMRGSRGQLRQHTQLGSGHYAGCDGRSSTCSSVATASSDSSQPYSTLQQGTTSADMLWTHHLQQQQRQPSIPAAAAAAGEASDLEGTHRAPSWHDSWDDEIDAFCDRLLPPPGRTEAQGPWTCDQPGQHQIVIAGTAQNTAAAHAYNTDQNHQQQREQQVAGGRRTATAAAGPASPGCSRCRQLEVQLQALQFEADLAAAQAAAVAEERDLVLLQQQSLLQLIAHQQMLEQSGS